MKNQKRKDGEGSINAGGYIQFQRNGVFSYEHIEIAEKALGKKLPAGAQIHHFDENPSNNTPENLVICMNQSYHWLLHRRTNALNASGNADYRKCRFCKEHDSPENLKKSLRTHFHPECMSNHRRGRYQEAKARGKSV